MGCLFQFFLSGADRRLAAWRRRRSRGDRGVGRLRHDTSEDAFAVTLKFVVLAGEDGDGETFVGTSAVRWPVRCLARTAG